MSYKPLSQTVTNGKTAEISSSDAVFDAIAAIPSPLPSQSTNGDKVLATDGTSASWQFAGLGAGSLGTNNVILGRAMPAGLTGTGVTLIGTTANTTSTSVVNSIAIGTTAVSGPTGIAIGTSVYTGSGTNVVAIGHSTGRSAATGNGNVIVGKGVGGGLTTGSSNIFIGPEQAGYAGPAGEQTTTGGSNVGIGNGALRVNTTGSSNVAVGTFAGGEVTTGSDNTFLGFFSGIYGGNVTGAIALGSSSKGISNALTVGGDASSKRINTVYLGQGGNASTTANAVKIMTMIPDGTANRDLSAGTLTLAGSQSNGSAAGGDVIIATAPAGASGSTTNAHVERLRVTASGNVGIGTSSPGAKLNVSGSWPQLRIDSSGNESGLLLYNSNVFLGGFYTDVGGANTRVIAGVGHALRLLAGSTTGDNSEVMRLTASGRVGILTTTPSEVLDVVGNIKASGTITANGSSLTVDGTQSQLVIRDTTAYQGSLGYINSNIRFSAATGNGIRFQTNSSNGEVNERMRITSAGDVGIGTSTPTAKLEVNGNVLANEYRVPNYRLDPHTHDEGTETGNFTINWANGAVHSVTLNAAGPLVITMNNPVNGGAYALRIIQGATPGTVTWPASVKWPGGTAPTLSAVTGQVDVVNFLYYADTGFYYGTFANNFS